MELQPSEPPGNAQRKLRSFVAEIARLRAEGYTIRAIHQALKNAGVIVAWATVQREVQRLAQNRPDVQRLTETGPALKSPSAEPSAMNEPVSRNETTAAEVDTYFAQHNPNPLFKRKDKKS
jgi:hypothetical protein